MGPGSVLVTGASSGIGAATARLLRQRGYRVFGTSRRLREPGSAGIHWVAMDLREDASVRAAVAEVEAQGVLAGLVCNAGIGVFGSVEELGDAEVRQQFDVNVFGTLRTLRAVLPGMRAARRGRIAIVGSLAGRAPIPFQAHYSATKAALDAIALALHNEVRPCGIHVSLIEPGDISTPFNDAMVWGDPGRSVYGERVRRAETVIRESLPRAPGPEVVARAIARALGARRPRVRYAVGPDSTLVALGRRLLPDRLALRLIRSHFDV